MSCTSKYITTMSSHHNNNTLVNECAYSLMGVNYICGLSVIGIDIDTIYV